MSVEPFGIIIAMLISYSGIFLGTLLVKIAPEERVPLRRPVSVINQMTIALSVLFTLFFLPMIGKFAVAIAMGALAWWVKKNKNSEVPLALAVSSYLGIAVPLSGAFFFPMVSLSLLYFTTCAIRSIDRKFTNLKRIAFLSLPFMAMGLLIALGIS